MINTEWGLRLLYSLTHATHKGQSSSEGHHEDHYHHHRYHQCCHKLTDIISCLTCGLPHHKNTCTPVRYITLNMN